MPARHALQSKSSVLPAWLFYDNIIGAKLDHLLGLVHTHRIIMPTLPSLLRSIHDEKHLQFHGVLVALIGTHTHIRCGGRLGARPGRKGCRRLPVGGWGDRLGHGGGGRGRGGNRNVFLEEEKVCTGEQRNI